MRKNHSKIVCIKLVHLPYLKNDEVFQMAKEERSLLKVLKNRRHSWTGHIIRHNEFVVNILERAILGKKAVGKPRLQYLKQVARNTELTVIQQRKDGLATVPDGKLQTKGLKDKKKTVLNSRGP